MEIDFLKALKNVLEDIVRTGKVYERSKIRMTPTQYRVDVCTDGI